MKKRAIDNLKIVGFKQTFDVMTRPKAAFYERKTDEDDFIEIVHTEAKDVYVILYHSGLELMRADSYICPDNKESKSLLEQHLNIAVSKVYGDVDDL